MKEALLDKIKGYGIYTIVFFVLFFGFKFIFPAYYEKVLYLYLILASIFVLSSLGLGDKYGDMGKHVTHGYRMGGKEFWEEEDVHKVEHTLPPLLDIIFIVYVYVPPILCMYITHMV